MSFHAHLDAAVSALDQTDHVELIVVWRHAVDNGDLAVVGRVDGLEYQCSVAVPALDVARRGSGARSHRPCSGVPSNAAKQAAESKRGNVSQSIEPSRADERRGLQVGQERVVTDGAGHDSGVPPSTELRVVMAPIGPRRTNIRVRHGAMAAENLYSCATCGGSRRARAASIAGRQALELGLLVSSSSSCELGHHLACRTARATRRCARGGCCPDWLTKIIWSTPASCVAAEQFADLVGRADRAAQRRRVPAGTAGRRAPGRSGRDAAVEAERRAVLLELVPHVRDARAGACRRCSSAPSE